MPKYQAITKTDFANLRWKRYENYHFAALDAVAREKRGQVHFPRGYISRAFPVPHSRFLSSQILLVRLAIQEGIARGNNRTPTL